MWTKGSQLTRLLLSQGGHHPCPVQRPPLLLLLLKRAVVGTLIPLGQSPSGTARLGGEVRRGGYSDQVQPGLLVRRPCLLFGCEGNRRKRDGGRVCYSGGADREKGVCSGTYCTGHLILGEVSQALLMNLTSAPCDLSL